MTEEIWAGVQKNFTPDYRIVICLITFAVWFCQTRGPDADEDTSGSGIGEYRCLPEKPVTGVALNQTELTLKEGESADLTVTVEPADADDTTVTWSSDKPEVAAVENGNPIQSLIVDISNMNQILSQLDALDEILTTGIPVIFVTDTANSFDLGVKSFISIISVIDKT